MSNLQPERVSALIKRRAVAFETLEALPATASDADYSAARTAVEDLDKQIKRARDVQQLAASSALEVGTADADVIRVQITDDTDPYVSEKAAIARGLGTHKGLRAVAAFKLFSQHGGDLEKARAVAERRYGARHVITRGLEPIDVNRRDVFSDVQHLMLQRALTTSVGASGGFIVPPDYVNEIIELLRPKAVVRGAGPRVIPMPRGTMTFPAQTAPGVAGYGSELAQIASSQQQTGQIVASFKKLTALTPVSNDLMRYADPAADAFVRDDLVKIIALREDLAFLIGDGTSASPYGYLFFANRYISTRGGTMGNWLSTANSTFAVNAADPSQTTGGNFITSNETYTLQTVAAELGGAINRLDTANVSDSKRVWFMHPRSYNYLFNVQNSLGVYVYRQELKDGTLLGYPFKKSTQIPINIWDATGTNKDCSFVFLTEMDEDMILDSMTLELAVSREGTYVDSVTGSTVSAFQNDQTLIRAIAEHDHQIRHDQAVAVIQAVRWAPAIS